MLIDFHKNGRIDLGGFVTETIGLDDVEEAFEKMGTGRGAPIGRAHPLRETP